MDEIEIPVWVSRSPLMIRRDCLDADDPDHTYNYIKKTYNVNPEDYGIQNPGICPHCGQKLASGETYEDSVKVG